MGPSNHQTKMTLNPPPPPKTRTAFEIILLICVVFSAVSGWALASDSVEIQSISFVIPAIDESASNDSIHPTSIEEGALQSIIFLGMMVGGYMWGTWADIAGRRTCLVTSLVVNGLFDYASSLSPNFILFLIFRFLSGVG